MKLTVLGPGCWGLTLAWLLNDNFEDITIWGRESDLYEDLVINKHCSKPLEVQLDKRVEITSDLKKAIDGADIILSVVATSGVRPVCEQLKAAGINPKTPCGRKRFLMLFTTASYSAEFLMTSVNADIINYLYKFKFI